MNRHLSFPLHAVSDVASVVEECEHTKPAMMVRPRILNILSGILAALLAIASTVTDALILERSNEWPPQAPCAKVAK